MKSSQYTVKLSGMPYRAKAEDIRKFLTDVRIADTPDAIEFTKNSNNLPTGDCYVALKSSEDVARAVSYNRKFMGNRYVEVREVTSQTQLEVTPKNRYTGNFPIIKMRGLPYECTKEEIKKFFSGLNITENGIIMPVDDVGRASGDAFVEFSTKEDFEKALTYDRKNMGRRYVEVFKSSHSDMNEAVELIAGGKYQVQNRSKEHAPDRTKPYERNTFSPYESRNRFTRSSARACSYHAIHALGLPFNALESEVADFFYPVIPDYVRILLDTSKRPSGEAYIYFRSHRDCIDAMTKDGHQIGNRFVVLTPYTRPDNEQEIPESTAPYEVDRYHDKMKMRAPRSYYDYPDRNNSRRYENRYEDSRRHYPNDDRPTYERYAPYTVGEKSAPHGYNSGMSPREGYAPPDPFRSEMPFRVQEPRVPVHSDRGVYSKDDPHSSEYQTPPPLSHWSGIKDPNAPYHHRHNRDMGAASPPGPSYVGGVLYTDLPRSNSRNDQHMGPFSYNPFAVASSANKHDYHRMMDGNRRD